MATERRAGIIEKLELTNFMCHENLVLTLNSRVNFIVGKNGSGKSAIMTAIMIVLGARATDTCRGKLLTEFIRIGCHTAKVRITLSNTGIKAYKPDKYGTRIIIEREITSSSTATKFKIGSDRIGLQATSFKVVEEIVTEFSILLPNSFAIMTQETMKTFFISSNPSEMYKLVQDGTGMKYCQLKLGDLITQSEYCTAKILELKKDLKTVEDEYDVWLKRKTLLGRIDKAKEELETLKSTLLWAEVKKAEEALTTQEELLKKFMTLKGEKEKAIGTYKEKQNEYKEKINEADENISRYNDQKEALDIEKEQFALKFQDINNSIKDLKSKVNTVDRDIMIKNNDRQASLIYLEKIQKGTSSEEIAHRLKLKEDIRKYEGELMKLQAEPLEFGNEGILENQIYNKGRAVKELREKLEFKKNSLKKNESDFSYQKRVKTTIPPGYGPHISAIIAEIDKLHALGKFSKKPIGPIGLNVKVNDIKWKSAVEYFLKDELRDFYVNNAADCKLLTSIFKRISPNNIPSIVTSTFVDQVYDVRRDKTPSTNEYTCVMDMLKVDDPIVMNYLIDQKGIENVILCENLNYLMRIMKNRNTAPPKCRMAISINGDNVFPWPSYRYYMGTRYQCQLLEASREDGLKFLEEEIRNGHEELKAMEKELSTIDRELLNMKGELRQMRDKMQQYNKQEKSINNKLKELRRIDEEKENDETSVHQDLIDNLTQELDESQSIINSLKQDKTQLKADIEEKIKEKTRHENIITGLIEDYNELQKRITEAENLLYENQILLEDEKLRENGFLRKLEESDAKQREIEAAIEIRRKYVQTATQTATAECPNRIESEQCPDSLRNTIRNKQSYINSFSRYLENPEIIKEKVRDLAKQRSTLYRNIIPLELVIKNSDNNLLEKKTVYRDNVLVSMQQIASTFEILIKKQHFMGKLTFNHGKKELKIELTQKGETEKLKNLSGGERSFTTITLIIAVWEKLRFPFFMLDEFDVYMDMANRRYCADLLLTEAKFKKDRQFFFFTPQEINLEADADITIHKLKDPRQE